MLLKYVFYRNIYLYQVSYIVAGVLLKSKKYVSKQKYSIVCEVKLAPNEYGKSRNT